MTQAAFAAEMDVSRKWLSEMENGKQTVELGIVLAVFRRLGFNLVAAEKSRAPFDFDAALRSLVNLPASLPTDTQESDVDQPTTPPSEPEEPDA